MKKSMKILCAVLALVLTLSCGVGATLAFISHSTKEVENTFVFGNLELKLEETGTTEENGVAKKNYTIIPGTDLTKDPKVTVSTPEGAADVPCYVFVTVKEVNWPNVKATDGSRKVDYKMADGWGLYDTQADGTKVYVRGTKDAPDIVTPSGTPFHVLAGDKVTVSSELSKIDIDACNGKVPTLTFKAYAVQRAGFNTVDAAWTQAQTLG